MALRRPEMHSAHRIWKYLKKKNAGHHPGAFDECLRARPGPELLVSRTGVGIVPPTLVGPPREVKECGFTSRLLDWEGLFYFHSTTLFRKPAPPGRSAVLEG